MGRPKAKEGFFNSGGVAIEAASYVGVWGISPEEPLMSDGVF